MLLRDFLLSWTMLATVPVFADTVTLNRTGEIKRPLKEVREILLAFDQTCEKDCFYYEAKLKESKILSRVDNDIVIWTDYAEILTTRTYKHVLISSPDGAPTTIHMAYPTSAELVDLQAKFGYKQDTKLDRDEQLYTLEEITAADGSASTRMTVDATFAGTLIKGFAITTLKKSFNDRMDTRYAMLATAPLLATTRAEVSWYSHIKPIVDAHCQGCHVKNGIAPFALNSYQQVKGMGDAILAAIDDRTMPPWNAQVTPNHSLKYDFSLNDEKIKLFHDWVNAGYPLGDADHPGPAIVLKSPAIQNPDLILGMDAPHKPAKVSHDEYRCFPLSKPNDAEFFITGFATQSTNQRIVHHVAIYAFDPEYASAVSEMDGTDSDVGYSCFGAPNAAGYENLPSRLIGTSGYPALNFSFPEGTGTRMRPGTQLVLQIHYSLYGVGESAEVQDQTTVKLKTAQIVDHDLANVFFSNMDWIGGNMLIPAGQSEVIHSFSQNLADNVPAAYSKGSLDLSHGVFLRAVFPHEHLLGKGLRLYRVAADGSKELLFNNWDLYEFHFQWTYQFDQPIWIAASDKLRLECKWDNSAANQPEDEHGQARVPKDTNWGESSSDEMCVVVLAVTEH